MAEIIIRNTNETDPFVRILQEIEGSKKDALKEIGGLLEHASTQAFPNSRFGSHRWAIPYPNETDPYVHRAGLVQDFRKGATRPNPRRLTRGRALVGTGHLRRSIRSEVVSGDRVEIGSNAPYAAQHQWGLVSTQQYGQGTKKRIAKWLLSKQGRPYQKKLAFLTMPNRNTLDTETVQRPFLGVPRNLHDDIRKTVEAYASGAS